MTGEHSLTKNTLCLIISSLRLFYAQLAQIGKRLCACRSYHSVNNTPHWIKIHLQMSHKLTLTFISWLISLFTGCAGFLLRLFSGGLPFSISGIVVALVGSDPDQCWVSAGGFLAELLWVKAVIPGDSGCHSRTSESLIWGFTTSPVNMRALQVGGSAAEQSLLSLLRRRQASDSIKDMTSGWVFQNKFLVTI